MTKISLSELLKVFLKLGLIGFGGPAAHMALMRDEIVAKRKWISEGEFFDLIGATNLIPGPNSTELAIHIGHKLRGMKGLLITGASFILPAFFCVLTLSYLYVEYGSLPELNPILTGIRPVIVAIVFLALLKFRETAVNNWQAGLVALLSLLGVKSGINEVFVIFLAGFFQILLRKVGDKKLSIAPLSLFLYFLKVGSVLFGSGYVLLAFLQKDLVLNRTWLTSAQLLDAITIGQFTPGPVFTTATFIGYLLHGLSGAVLATIGIFLPSFFFVALSAPFIPKLRASSTFSHFLNGVNAASFTLMLIVCLQLGVKSIFNYGTVLFCIVSLFLLKFTKINSAWPIMAGGALGYFLF